MSKTCLGSNPLHSAHRHSTLHDMIYCLDCATARRRIIVRVHSVATTGLFLLSSVTRLLTHVDCSDFHYNVVKFTTKKHVTRGGYALASDRPPDRSQSFPGTARDPPSRAGMWDLAVGREVDGRAVEINVPMSRCAL